LGRIQIEEAPMAKGQMRSNREKKKPRTSAKHNKKGASPQPQASQTFPAKFEPERKGK
jgi:hypothetical protein